MTPRSIAWTAAGLLALLMLGGCAAPRLLPEGPTPIPTLIPVTDGPSMSPAVETPAFSIQSYPVQPPSASDGLATYGEYCSECHGVDGTGTVPAARNFRDVDYMRGETPASFYIAITEGQGAMPSYADSLTSDERWDVVFYIWQMSTSADLIETGQALYGRDCASCHGIDGDDELIGATDFTDLRHMSDRAPRDLYTITTQGRGSMPAYQSLLSQDERWSILDYIRTFTYEPSLADLPATGSADDQQADGVVCLTDQMNPYAWDDADAIQAGETLYQESCRGCHGADGSGGLPNTPDFTSAEVNAELLNQPGGYYCALTNGIGAMPAYGETLTDDERWTLIAYLGSLRP